MSRTGTICAVLGLALMVGGMVFFGAVMAPLIFTKLPPDVAGPFIRQVFPLYYAFVAGTAFLALIGFLLRGQGVSGLVMVLVIAAVLWAWWWLIPHLNVWRLAGEAQKFDRGHKISTWLNGAELLAGIWLLVRVALR